MQGPILGLRLLESIQAVPGTATHHSIPTSFGNPKLSSTWELGGSAPQKVTWCITKTTLCDAGNAISICWHDQHYLLKEHGRVLEGLWTHVASTSSMHFFPGCGRRVSPCQTREALQVSDIHDAGERYMGYGQWDLRKSFEQHIDWSEHSRSEKCLPFGCKLE